MTHVYTNTSSAKGKGSTVQSSTVQPVPEAEIPRALESKPVAKPVTPAKIDPERRAASLLDIGPQQRADHERATTAGSYTRDLLGIDIEGSEHLPAPVQASTNVKDNRDHIVPPPALHDPQEILSQLASFLPLLQSMALTDAVDKLGSVKLQLQQKISNMDRVRVSPDSQPAETPLRKPVDTVQLASSDGTYRARVASKEDTAVPRSLAKGVEQQTQEWRKRVIASTESIKGSIFGEHVIQSRWIGRHRSTTSVTSTSGLVEGIQKLQLDDKVTPAMPPAKEDDTVVSQQYSKVNPFGPNPTVKVQSGATQTHQEKAVRPHQPRGVARPHLPAFLPPASKAEDHGAAARAQYMGSALNEPIESAGSRNATAGARKEEVQPAVRKESISSTGSSQISPGLGENMVRPGRRNEHQFFSHQPQLPPVAPSRVRPSRPPNISSAAPRPPSFLAQGAQPAADPGAAARRQYGQAAHLQPFNQPALQETSTSRPPAADVSLHVSSQPNVTTGGAYRTENLPPNVRHREPHEPSEMSHYQSSRNVPMPDMKKSKGPAPQIASWLPQSKETDDPGAAARNQYGGKENHK